MGELKTDVTFEWPSAENAGRWNWTVTKKGQGVVATGSEEQKAQAVGEALAAKSRIDQQEELKRREQLLGDLLSL